MTKLLPAPAAATAAAAALMLSVSASDAAVTGFTPGKGFTEGNGHNRAQVAGTHDLSDAASDGGGFDLGAFSAGETIGIYGRIISLIDTFTFEYTGPGDFKVRFDLDGYDYDLGGSAPVGRSGFVNHDLVLGGPEAEVEKGSTFKLLDDEGSMLEQMALTTNRTDIDVLFSGYGAGTYQFVVDGTTGPYLDTAALYDVYVTGADVPLATTPIPLAGLLLLSALGGGAVAYRRRKAA